MRITGQKVLELVAGYYDLTVDELTGARQIRRIARPRQVAMYLMKVKCDHLTAPMIGTILGGRDHSTILWGVSKIKELLEIDVDIKRAVSILTGRMSMSGPDPLLEVRIIETERHLEALYNARGQDLNRLSP